MRIAHVVAAAGLLAACNRMESTEEAFVSPLAGQTGVPLEMDLLVKGGAVEIPPDYPMGEVIRVVDLVDGGFVPGTLTMDGLDLRFAADDGWAEDRRYAWTVDPAAHVPHGPELPIPAHLVGTSAFGTGEGLDLLGSTLDLDGRACVVASRPTDEADPDDLRVTVNDVALDDAALIKLDPTEWTPGFALDEVDPYVDVWCLETATPLEAGGALRVWWGDSGPWRMEIRDVPVGDLVIELSRGDLP